jgi:hypothetical protein
LKLTLYSTSSPQNMGLLSINPVPFDLAAKVQEVVHMFMV